MAFFVRALARGLVLAAVIFLPNLKSQLESANIGVAAAFQACKIAVVIEALNQRSARQQNNGVRTDAALLSDKAQTLRCGGLHRDPFNR